MSLFGLKLSVAMPRKKRKIMGSTATERIKACMENVEVRKNAKKLARKRSQAHKRLVKKIKARERKESLLAAARGTMTASSLSLMATKRAETRKRMASLTNGHSSVGGIERLKGGSALMGGMSTRQDYSSQIKASAGQVGLTHKRSLNCGKAKSS